MCMQIPAVLIRIALTVVCMPFVWLVVRLVTLGINTNDPIVGWRRAIIRPFLRFWARILLHIGFNFWPRLIGGQPSPASSQRVRCSSCAAHAVTAR